MTNEFEHQDGAVAVHPAAHAQGLYERLSRTLEDLMATLDEEAALIRGAKLRDAAALGTRKAMLAEDYRRGLGVLREDAETANRIAPEELQELKARHRELETILQTNLAVLATARTVSEALVKSVADAMGAKTPQPSTYSADARRTGTDARPAPIAVDTAF
ncbi:hypothetical protein [Lutibaculum baratangense]|uniref:Flagellar protein FlgN n=1 Tax=Lutibaculum baratangense AMV1 TaxID=631454 RepID=V4TLV1_9HYPH|nr:hypothetical protein [Lutibaculum baratangense]ESR26768.1 hypothetical protein N177_0552 [Lutibaculum baratangense AMV1]